MTSTLSTALIFAHDLDRLARFYEALLEVKPTDQGPQLREYALGGAHLMLHAIPASIAAGFSIATPPVVRDEAAIRLTFTVDSLSVAQSTAAAMGGGLSDSGWESGPWRFANGFDPEGNVFQLRALCSVSPSASRAGEG